MKERTINVDGVPVTIRPMDKDHVIDMCGPERANGKSDPAFQRFHRELMERYGNSAIVAWCAGRIVGHVNFQPSNVITNFPVCPEHVPEQPQVEWPAEPSRTLNVGCVNVNPALCRKGIGSALVEALIEWAGEQGCTAIVADANDTGWWKPCKPFWEKLGFHVKRTKDFTGVQDAPDKYVYDMELILSDDPNRNRDRNRNQPGRD